MSVNNPEDEITDQNEYVQPGDIPIQGVVIDLTGKTRFPIDGNDGDDGNPGDDNDGGDEGSPDDNGGGGNDSGI